MSSDEEDEGNRTLTASVKRWWTGSRLERQACPFFLLCVEAPQILQQVSLTSLRNSGSQQASASVHCVCLQNRVVMAPEHYQFQQEHCTHDRRLLVAFAGCRRSSGMQSPFAVNGMRPLELSASADIDLENVEK